MWVTMQTAGCENRVLWSINTRCNGSNSNQSSHFDYNKVIASTLSRLLYSWTASSCEAEWDMAPSNNTDEV